MDGGGLDASEEVPGSLAGLPKLKKVILTDLWKDAAAAQTGDFIASGSPTLAATGRHLPAHHAGCRHTPTPPPATPASGLPRLPVKAGAGATRMRLPELQVQAWRHTALLGSTRAGRALQRVCTVPCHLPAVPTPLAAPSC